MTVAAILEVFVWTVAIYWGVPFTISMAYAGALWAARDIQYEGTIWWRGVFPAFRFRLLPTRGWLARLWQNWYGQALFLVIIHKDLPGKADDSKVEKVIVHEMRHVAQQWALGIMHWVIYGLHSAYLAIFTRKNPYRDNIFERDARAAVGFWVMRGRPRRFDLGQRQ